MNESTNVPEREELTPVCDPPARAPSQPPIGHSWWIEPSHPEVDPGITVEVPDDDGGAPG